MSYDLALAAWVCEALEPLGVVVAKPLFGGAGLYLDGRIFAILGRDDLWFKSDAGIDAEWDALSTERFTVSDRHGRSMTMNYRRAPTEAHDDAETMQRYARLAMRAGGRHSR